MIDFLDISRAIMLKENRQSFLQSAKLRFFLLAIILVFSMKKVNAQQDFINGFYMFNPLAFNPAIVGVNDQVSISAVAREQWTGLNGAPSTQYVNAHLPINVWAGKNRFSKYPAGLSLGLSVVNDKIGATSYTKLSIPVGVKIRLTQSGIRLSLGLSFEGASLSANYDDLRGYDPNEVGNSPSPGRFIDFSTGLYAYHDTWYAGVSVTNIRQQQLPDYSFFFDRHYYATAGYAHVLSSKYVLRLTTLAVVVPNTPFSMTATPAVIIDDLIETGVSYRYHDMCGAFFTIKPTDNLRIGYWYEYAIGNKTSEVGATHEIVLTYEFDAHKKKVVSPRYFW